MFNRVYRHVHRTAGPGSSTWRLKKMLAALIVFGALSSVTATGTFALLNSEERNTHSGVASGTLTFDNVVNTGTACFSYGGPSSPGNANTSCQALITSATLNYPGVAITPVKVTITNDGSIDAGDLSVYMPSCTAAATPGAPAPGGADPCATNGAQFYIQETTSTGTPTQCWFPSAVGACSFAASSLHVRGQRQHDDERARPRQRSRARDGALLPDRHAAPVHRRQRAPGRGRRLRTHLAHVDMRPTKVKSR